ncbi:hypothetical protein O9993_16670 [Vibrio lentus]|nr:hypothetical protein [Vibrio lentus]
MRGVERGVTDRDSGIIRAMKRYYSFRRDNVGVVLMIVNTVKRAVAG